MRRGNAKIIGEHIFLHDDKEGWTKSNWPSAAARPPAQKGNSKRERDVCPRLIDPQVFLFFLNGFQNKSLFVVERFIIYHIHILEVVNIKTNTFD